MSNLWQKTNYTSSVKYITDTVITEYDMKSAGMNILREMNYLNDNQYERLKDTEKYERNVIIGKMLRKNKNMNHDLNEGFKLARKIFMDQNNLNDSDILSIKKDAIFVIGKKCSNLRISKYLRFVEKKEYDTYINILNKEHYIQMYNNYMDVKGYHENIFNHHQKYLFQFIIDCLWEDKKDDKKDLFKKLLIFKNNLINYNLPIGYYKDIIEDKYIIELETMDLEIEDLEEDLQVKDLSYKNQLRFLTDFISILF